MEQTIERPAAGAPAAPARGAAPIAEPAPRQGRINRRLVVPILAVVLLIALGFGYRAYYNATHFVWTDNAQVAGTMVQVGALNAGQVQAVLTDVGQRVTKGQVLARVLVPQTVGTTASGQPEQGFTPAANQVVDVTSPLDGVVVAKLADVGSTVEPGQGIVAVIDPRNLYIVANVDETDLPRVRPGEPVDVTVDSLGETIPGRVEAVTRASAASFSLIPQSNTSGNFTKVVQVVPVSIAVDAASYPLVLGSSVEVSIHVQ